MVSLRAASPMWKACRWLCGFNIVVNYRSWRCWDRRLSWKKNARSKSIARTMTLEHYFIIFLNSSSLGLSAPADIIPERVISSIALDNLSFFYQGKHCFLIGMTPGNISVPISTTLIHLVASMFHMCQNTSKLLKTCNVYSRHIASVIQKLNPQLFRSKNSGA